MRQVLLEKLCRIRFARRSEDHLTQKVRGYIRLKEAFGEPNLGDGLRRGAVACWAAYVDKVAARGPSMLTARERCVLGFGLGNVVDGNLGANDKPFRVSGGDKDPLITSGKRSVRLPVRNQAGNGKGGATVLLGNESGEQPARVTLSARPVDIPAGYAWPGEVLARLDLAYA